MCGDEIKNNKIAIVEESEQNLEQIENIDDENIEIDDERESDDLNEQFKKIELEAEIDKLRVDASKKSPILDNLFKEGDDEKIYSAQGKFIYSIFLKYGFSKLDIDFNEAKKYFLKAIAEGYSPAMVELGEMIKEGKVIGDRDLTPKKLFEKSLKYGIDHPFNIYETIFYAKMLLLGYGVDIDFEKSYKLLMDEKIDNHPFADGLKGLLFYKKESPYRDEKKAFLYWITALKNEDQFVKDYIKKEGIDPSLSSEDLIESVWN